ncbi:MAG: hypothetical protein NZM07_03735, partial [Elioraea sp.]|nr:hypothetical protein [Elioraea sp.]
MFDLLLVSAEAAHSPLNRIFLALIGCALLAALVGLFVSGALRRFADQAPSFLTGLGLLGTFAGIFVSL